VTKSSLTGKIQADERTNGLHKVTVQFPLENRKAICEFFTGERSQVGQAHSYNLLPRLSTAQKELLERQSPRSVFSLNCTKQLAKKVAGFGN